MHELRTLFRVSAELDSAFGDSSLVFDVFCVKILECFGLVDVQLKADTKILLQIISHRSTKFAETILSDLLVFGVLPLISLACSTSPAVALKNSFLSSNESAGMLVSCGCNLILILDRAISKSGRYVGKREIVLAAREYTSNVIQHDLQTEAPQETVRKCVNEVTWTSLGRGMNFMQLRTDMLRIIQKNRFSKAKAQRGLTSGSGGAPSQTIGRLELPRTTSHRDVRAPSGGVRESPRNVGSRDSPRNVGGTESPKGSGNKQSPSNAGIETNPETLAVRSLQGVLETGSHQEVSETGTHREVL